MSGQMLDDHTPANRPAQQIERAGEEQQSEPTRPAERRLAEAGGGSRRYTSGPPIGKVEV